MGRSYSSLKSWELLRIGLISCSGLLGVSLRMVWLPGCLAHNAFDIPKWRNARAPSCSESSGVEYFTIVLFVDDGILIEPNLGTRCEASAICWEHACELTFGPDSANVDKLEEEGNWEAKKLVSGYLLDTDSWSISIPEAKIFGAQSLILSPYLNYGNRILPLGFLQELRGNVAHWSKTGWIWNRSAQPIGRMLGFGELSGLRIRRNDANLQGSIGEPVNFSEKAMGRLSNPFLDCAPKAISLTTNILSK